MYVGTHYIRSITTIIETNETKITTQYFEESSASGALYVLVFVTNDGDVDFAKSVLLALDKDISLNYTLTFSLSPGGYRVFVYDIEQDGTLPSGVGYPAVRSELITSGNHQGSNNKN